MTPDQAKEARRKYNENLANSRVYGQNLFNPNNFNNTNNNSNSLTSLLSQPVTNNKFIPNTGSLKESRRQLTGTSPAGDGYTPQQSLPSQINQLTNQPKTHHIASVNHSTNDGVTEPLIYCSYERKDTDHSIINCPKLAAKRLKEAAEKNNSNQVNSIQSSVTQNPSTSSYLQPFVSNPPLSSTSTNTPSSSSSSQSSSSGRVHESRRHQVPSSSHRSNNDNDNDHEDQNKYYENRTRKLNSRESDRYSSGDIKI